MKVGVICVSIHADKETEAPDQLSELVDGRADSPIQPYLHVEPCSTQSLYLLLMIVTVPQPSRSVMLLKVRDGAKTGRSGGFMLEWFLYNSTFIIVSIFYGSSIVILKPSDLRTPLYS